MHVRLQLFVYAFLNAYAFHYQVNEYISGLIQNRDKSDSPKGRRQCSSIAMTLNTHTVNK